MFTGIITDVGRVVAIEPKGDTRFVVETAFDTGDIPIGASIAHNGVCLTVVAKTERRYAIEASGETLACTTLGDWQVGTAVNLERSLRLGDELGGHLVFGHVDGVGEVVDRAPEGDSLRFAFRAPEVLAPMIATKGSIAVDGVSLTINEVEGCRFGVNIIAHTQTATNFGEMAVGDRVNLEVDMLARYVARQLAARG